MRVPALIPCVVLAACGCSVADADSSGANPEGAAVASAETLTAAKSLYGQNCARCHGFNMVNPAPGIFDLRTFPPDDKPRFIASVTNGKGAMPSWKDALSPQQIEMLWTYITAAKAP
jgi:mono/diheme cytochrome c family protein